jgi:hypothetical protein
MNKLYDILLSVFQLPTRLAKIEKNISELNVNDISHDAKYNYNLGLHMIIHKDYSEALKLITAARTIYDRVGNNEMVKECDSRIKELKVKIKG